MKPIVILLLGGNIHTPVGRINGAIIGAAVVKINFRRVVFILQTLPGFWL
jgi:hypothetical protein